MYLIGSANSFSVGLKVGASPRYIRSSIEVASLLFCSRAAAWEYEPSRQPSAASLICQLCRPSNPESKLNYQYQFIDTEISGIVTASAPIVRSPVPRIATGCNLWLLLSTAKRHMPTRRQSNAVSSCEGYRCVRNEVAKWNISQSFLPSMQKLAHKRGCNIHRYELAVFLPFAPRTCGSLSGNRKANSEIEKYKSLCNFNFFMFLRGIDTKKVLTETPRNTDGGDGAQPGCTLDVWPPSSGAGN